MKLKFKERTTLTVVESYDEHLDLADDSYDVFMEGEEVDVDIVGQTKEFVDIQFGDGSVAFSVPKSLFEDCAKLS